MEHHFLDRYSELTSPIHRLDPRVKIISALSFILIVVLSGPVQLFQATFWMILVTIAIFLSRVPLLFIFKRSLTIIPFVLLVGLFIPFLREGEAIGSYNLGVFRLSLTREGSEIFKNILCKSYLSILALILLTSTTRFSDLNLGLSKLRFPRILILLSSFMYRYIFVFVDELLRMEQGRKARQVRRPGFSDVRIIGNIAGVLFIRSFERGERVYQAMLARGFRGEFPEGRRLRVKAFDILTLVFFLGASGVIGFLGLSG